MKHHTLFDVDAWVTRQFKPAPNPSTPVVDMPPAFAPESKRSEKVAKKPRPFLTVEHRGPSPDVRRIMTEVSRITGLSMVEIRGPTRMADVIVARHIAMFLARRFTGRSLPAIAQEFSRDHTTVLHGIRQVQRIIRDRGIKPYADTPGAWAADLIPHVTDDQTQRWATRSKFGRYAKK